MNEQKKKGFFSRLTTFSKIMIVVVVIAIIGIVIASSVEGSVISAFTEKPISELSVEELFLIIFLAVFWGRLISK